MPFWRLTATRLSVRKIERMKVALHRFAIFTACCTVLLLTAGALVTSNDAGDSVPDWPLAYGVLFPPLVGNILFEFGHRVIAAVVAILTASLALWLWRVDSRAWIRKLGYVAFSAVITQALLGGLRVLNPHLSTPIAMVHAGLAQIFFCGVVSLAVFTSQWWNEPQPIVEDTGSPQLTTLALWTVVLVFLQLMLGAAYRHKAFGAARDLAAIFPHIVNAFVVLTMVIITSRAIRKRFSNVSGLRKPAIVLSAFIGLQLVLGLAAYLTVVANRAEPQPMPLMVWATVAHLVLGALTLATAVVLALCTFRVVRPLTAAELSPQRRAVA